VSTFYSALSKKPLQQRRALVAEQSAAHRRPPVARGLVEEARAVQDGAALFVVRSEDQPGDAGVADGAGAHGAGFQRDEQLQPGQAIVADDPGRRPQRQDLGVGGGIGKADGLVVRLGDDLSGSRIKDHGANRGLAGVGGGLRLGKGDAHGRKIMVEHVSDPNAPDEPGQASDAQASGERVAKALARAGVASRREVERLIAAGRVKLNGEVLTTPAVKVDSADVLTVDGRVVGKAEPARLWRYHKPVGLVTTHADPKGRPTVFEQLPKGLPRVISVGRLDLNSEGILLLTNDGGLARSLELPSSGLVRRYRARVRGQTTQVALDALRDGLTVDGVVYGPIQARLEPKSGEGVNHWIALSLAEGKNREVRKVLDALGLAVNRLIRVSYGPHQLGDLRPGEVAEVDLQGRALGGRLKPDSDAAPAPAVEAKTVYKPGWAKPKSRPPGLKKARGFPAARPPGKPSSPRSPTAGARPPKSSGARRPGPPRAGGPKQRG
jgi:23S rRNA pseudouridine2605 synthase